MESKKLPVLNENGYYEIRIESIGGLGANLCGKMMGELALKFLGLNSAGFSSYGSEKTGTPVKAYIRYSLPENEIREHSPIKKPHLLCIFHQALMQNLNIFDGCSEDTVIVINSEIEPERIAGHYMEHNNIKAEKIVCVPAQRIAMETRSRINVVMMGAMAKVMGFVQMEDIEKICVHTLGNKYPEALEGNLKGIRRGYKEIKEYICDVSDRNSKRAISEMDGVATKDSRKYKQGKIGYKNMTIGGINLNFGNSVTNDLSPSRQGYIPIFLQEKCINCGLCDLTCPDMVFRFEKGEYKNKEMMVNKGLDYFHCKGCLRCVNICPTNALVKGLEADYDTKPWFVSNKELVRLPDYYEKSGADGFITSESYLTEERIEGGEI